MLRSLLKITLSNVFVSVCVRCKHLFKSHRKTPTRLRKINMAHIIDCKFCKQSKFKFESALLLKDMHGFKTSLLKTSITE